MEILDFCTMLINLLCTFLLARLCIFGRPVGLVGLVMSSVLFYMSGLYADTILQIIMLFGFIYGWYNWHSKKDSGEFLTSIKKLNLKGWIITILVICIFTPIVSLLLMTYTDSTTPWLDSFTSVASLVCMYLAAKEYIDNWIIWMVVDSIYVFLYSYKGIHFAAFTTFVYLIIAMFGYMYWRKKRYFSIG